VSFGNAVTREPYGILIIGDSVIVGLREGSAPAMRLSPFNGVFNRFGASVVTNPTPPTGPSSIGALTSVGPLAPTTVVVDESHRAEATTLLPADASMQAIASRVRELSGLSDARLADLFKVTRETFNRWRSGSLANPTESARRRVGMVLHLLEELAAHGVNINDWLQNPNASDGITPYDLLLRGRIDKAAYLAAALDEVPLPTRADLDEQALVFDDDDEGWESFDIEVADDGE
jgi:hypothetical protein